MKSKVMAFRVKNPLVFLLLLPLILVGLVFLVLFLIATVLKRAFSPQVARNQRGPEIVDDQPSTQPKKREKNLRIDRSTVIDAEFKPVR